MQLNLIRKKDMGGILFDFFVLKQLSIIYEGLVIFNYKLHVDPTCSL